MPDPELEAIAGIDLSDDERVLALMAADCVYHEDPSWLDGRVFHGREEIAAILAEYRELWGIREQDLDQLVRLGGAILAGIRVRGVTPGGEIPVDQLWTYVFRMRGGQIAEMWAFADPDAARQKAAEIR